MKRIIPVLVLLLMAESMTVAGQATGVGNAQPPYRQYPVIPPFELLKVDSTTHLTRDSLQSNHPVLIMYFSPECDHCKHQTRDLLNAKAQFKDIEILMATYRPLSELRAFYHDFHIGNYPNIKIGRDEKYALPPFYRIRNFPFLALYDKNGNLITTFEGNQTIDTLLAAFHQK